ncbi:hypothetical protein G5V59_08300 [Nocardioides sp. W3-2-3]|nr:hypothetical protein [Nocardioides convexus]NHA00147.1 hypothetical protein [Nocardioides convexus]
MHRGSAGAHPGRDRARGAAAVRVVQPGADVRHPRQGRQRRRGHPGRRPPGLLRQGPGSGSRPWSRRRTGRRRPSATR